MNQGSRARSGGGELVRLPVRWVVLFTGYKATEDYEPAASDGEPPALVKEVTDICVGFHPHAEIRLFPDDAFLFWQATTTRDWIVTRVTRAPNPEGIRTALEYCSLVFDERTFQEIGYNPFHTHDLNLQEAVRQQFIDKKTGPVYLDLPEDSSLQSILMEANGQGASPSPGSAGTVAITGLSADRLSTPQNRQAVERYCANCAAARVIPASFATWWPSGAAIPPGYFEIVLRNAPQRTMTLREAVDETASLAAGIKGALPSLSGDDTVSVELEKAVLVNLDAAQREVSEAASRLSTETQDQFREHMSEASRSAGQVSANLNLLVKRLGAKIPATDAARLTRLAGRSDEIDQELRKIRHPNPFANSVVTQINAAATGAAEGGRLAANAAANSMFLRYIVAAVVIASIAATIAVSVIKRGAPVVDESNRPVRTHPTTVHHAPHPSAVAPTEVIPPTPSVDPILGLLVEDQDSVVASAKIKAHDAARQAAASETDGTLSEAMIERITVQSVKAAYKETLPGPKYDEAFVADSKPAWTYDKLKTALPSLVPTIHEAAALGAFEGLASRKIEAVTTKAAKDKALAAAATAAAAKAKAHDTSDVKPSPKPRHHTDTSSPSPPPVHHTPAKSARKERTSEPPKKAPSKSSPNPANTAGSAGSTGL